MTFLRQGYDAFKSLVLPRHLDDDELLEAANVTLVVTLATFFALVLVAVQRMLIAQFRLVPLFSMAAAASLLPLLFLKRGRIREAAGALLVILLGLLNWLLVQNDGIHDTAILAYPGVLIIAGLTLRRNGFLAILALTLASLGTIGYIQSIGIIKPKFKIANQLADSVDIVIVVAVIGMTVRLLSANMSRNLRRAREREKELEAQTRALAASESRYRALFDGANDAILIMSGDRFVDCNTMALTMFGCAEKSQILGHSPWEFSPPVQPDGKDSRSKARDLIEVAEGGESQRFAWKHLRKGGIPFDAEVSLNVAQIGADRFVQALVRDVTERAEAERHRQQLEMQLVRSQKLESIGTLAAGIAHDFNNILNIIMGNTGLLAAQPDDKEKLLRRVDAIAKASDRGAELVKQLLTFARKATLERRALPVNDVIQETARLLEGTFPKTVEIVLELASDLPPVLADSNQIHQVLLNLSVNARDAMPAGGRLRISSEFVNAAALKSPPSSHIGRDHILISVADSGTGMDDETRARIFDPFFTTKELGKGTGLGLAVVLGIIENHGGYVDLESHVGRGTDFRIYLPVMEQGSSAGSANEAARESIPGGTETVLYVEDERLARDVVAESLALKGYHVLLAADGEEGVAVYKAHAGKIALVISDLGLPKLDGIEMCRRIREMDGKIPFVLASGFFDPERRAMMEELAIAEVLQKPLKIPMLLTTIRRVIDQHARGVAAER